MKQNKRIFLLLLLLILLTSAKCNIIEKLPKIPLPKLPDFSKFIPNFQKKKKSDKKNKSSKKKKDSNNTKSNKKKKVKQPKIFAGITSDFNNTIEGKVARQIINDFCKENAIPLSIKKYKSKNAMCKNISKKPLTIILDPVSKKDISRYTNQYFPSARLYSPAIYFIIHSDKAESFRYPASLSKMQTGLHYQSSEYDYFSKVYGIGKNCNRYGYVSNLVTNFNNRSFDILVIGRTTWYEYAHRLPGIMLFYFEYGKPYQRITFTNRKTSISFDTYLKNKTDKEHDWISLVYKAAPSIEINKITESVTEEILNR